MIIYASHECTEHSGLVGIVTFIYVCKGDDGQWAVDDVACNRGWNWCPQVLVPSLNIVEFTKVCCSDTLA